MWRHRTNPRKHRDAEVIQEGCAAVGDDGANAGKTLSRRVGGRWALGVDEAMAEFDRTRVLSERKKDVLLLYCWNSNRRGDCDELDSAVL